MREITGDIWHHYSHGAIICITTNGIVKSNGQCVMGRGIAQQAAQRWPNLPDVLGTRIRESGNHVHWLSDFCIFTFPVKHYWREKADINLIQRSCEELLLAVNEAQIPIVCMVRPGCGNGGLDWAYVRPHMSMLDDRFTIVEWNGQ